MSNEEITNQDEVLEEVEQQDELVETPEEEVQEEKIEEVKMPSTKSGMIKALFDAVNGMKKEEVTAKWKSLMDVAEAEDLGGPTPTDSDNEKDEVGKKKKKIKASDLPEINVKEDIEALVQGEELSEEFKSKASTIFEAAVYQKVMETVTKKTEELEEEYSKNLQEEIISFRDELTEKVDGYLNYVVEE